MGGDPSDDGDIDAEFARLLEGGWTSGACLPGPTEQELADLQELRDRYSGRWGIAMSPGGGFRAIPIPGIEDTLWAETAAELARLIEEAQ